MIQNENGMSLISVMIAAGLMGLIAVFMMKMQENQLKTQNDLVARSEINQFMTTLTNSLAKPGYCEKNFEGIVLSPDTKVNLERIVSPVGTELYAVGKKYGNGSFMLKSFVQKSFDYDTEDKTTAIVQFQVGFEKAKKAFGAKVVNRDINIMVSLNQDEEGVEGEVLDCGTLGSFGGGITGGGSINTEAIKQALEVSEVFEDTDNKDNLAKTEADKETNRETLKKSDLKLDQEKVKKLIESNENLKMMQEAIRSIQESNKKFEEMEKNRTN